MKKKLCFVLIGASCLALAGLTAGTFRHTQDNAAHTALSMQRLDELELLLQQTAPLDEEPAADSEESTDLHMIERFSETELPSESEALTEEAIPAAHQVIFVGDSRTVGMGQAEKYDDCLYIGQSGEGYSWFIDSGLDQMDEAIRSHPGCPVVFNLGVNDCDAIDAYIELYHTILAAYADTNFYFMSVNPVTEDSLLVPNTDVITFNQKLQSTFPEQYIDTFSWMSDKGFESVDGVHYSQKQYRKIHDYAVRWLMHNS